MIVVTQFSDLTEINGTHYMGSRYETSYPTPKIKTQFIFATTAPWNSATDELKLQEFKAVRTMNNWFVMHKGEARAMTLWWKRMPFTQTEEAPATRLHWGRHYGDDRNPKYKEVCSRVPYLQASGCGFQLGTPPLNKRIYHKYFTLMRMPVNPTERQVKWLQSCNFSLLDSSAFSSYWVNGWPVETYDFAKVEKPFWEMREKAAPKENRVSIYGDRQ